MSFSTRFQTSRELLRRSIQVLGRNPRLLVFPVISLLCAFALGLFFLLPVLGVGFKSGWAAAVQWARPEVAGQRWFYAYGAMTYLVTLCSGSFFNVAFYHQILRALSGETVSIGAGLRFAATRWRAILMWGLLAGTVGLIIRAIEERLGWLGKIGMAFVGTAWSVAAVFAIPVIVRDNEVNPAKVLRHSVAMLKRTWGESLIGFVGIQLGGAMLLSLVAFSMLLLGMVMIGAHLSPLYFIALAIIGFVGWSIFIGVATDVYRCALYVYASEGVVPEGYTSEMMNAGWKVRKS